jgi:hypothetical protein
VTNSAKPSLGSDLSWVTRAEAAPNFDERERIRRSLILVAFVAFQLVAFVA